MKIETVLATEPLDTTALERIPREELNRRAIALGVLDAARLGSKAAVARAIREAQACQKGTDQS